MSVVKEKFVYGDAGEEFYLDIVDNSGYSFSYVRVYKRKQYRFLWFKWFKYKCINKDDSYTMYTNGDVHSLKIVLTKIFDDYNYVMDEQAYTKGWDRTFGVSEEKKKQLLRGNNINDILE